MSELHDKIIGLVKALGEESIKIEDKRGSRNAGWQIWSGFKLGLAMGLNHPKEAKALGEEILDPQSERLVRTAVELQLDEPEPGLVH